MQEPRTRLVLPERDAATPTQVGRGESSVVGPAAKAAGVNVRSEPHPVVDRESEVAADPVLEGVLTRIVRASATNLAGGILTVRVEGGGE